MLYNSRFTPVIVRTILFDPKLFLFEYTQSNASLWDETTISLTVTINFFTNSRFGTAVNV